jgi:hypothetical protein
VGQTLRDLLVSGVTGMPEDNTYCNLIMWVFKSLIKRSYLATNPKVLGQTLLLQKNLVRYTSRKRYIHFLQKEINAGLGPEYIMLVRNPYIRVESYFKEKLRQKVKMVFDEKPYILKRHQEIFYPYIGIKASDSLETKVTCLLNFSFKDFVARIPEVYQMEDHLAPQTFNFTRKVMGVERTMKMNRYVHVENEDEMNWLACHFGLDLSIRANSSSSESNERIVWDDESIAIVRSLYKRDFDLLGYEMNYPES